MTPAGQSTRIAAYRPMPQMTDDLDPTELEASRRDALYAVAAVSQGPSVASVAEARSLAVQQSSRFSENRTGTFYRAIDALEEHGLLALEPHPETDRTKNVRMTEGGETAFASLAERSDDISLGEPNNE